MSPRPEPAATHVSRRAVLVGGVAILAATSGCTLGGRPDRDGGDGGAGASPAEGAPEDPDVSVATEALAAVEAVLALAVATGSRHPDLETTLADTVAVHERHGALLVDAVPGATRPGPGGSPTGTPTATATASPSVDVPRSARRALQRLVTQERALVTEGKRLAFAAQSGAFARVLGSLAASAAQQATMLSAVATPRDRSRR